MDDRGMRKAVCVQKKEEGAALYVGSALGGL